ncbi:hypothetical protein [Pedobacter immunditicola]|uniref:hypothetical protein n=1 Tax=Pedobacter immunditicola TaxID=3133440 RepID=UPI0030B4B80D
MVSKPVICKITLQNKHLQEGSNVHDQGAEIKAGELAMSKGSLLSPAAIGFLAGIGTTVLDVYPMPKISIIVTGKELQQPGLQLNFGQVYESNSYSLSAALKLEGIAKVNIFQADDELSILTSGRRTNCCLLCRTTPSFCKLFWGPDQKGDWKISFGSYPG